MDAAEVLIWARDGIESAQDVPARQQFKLIEEGAHRLVVINGGKVPAPTTPVSDLTARFKDFDHEDLLRRMDAVEEKIEEMSKGWWDRLKALLSGKGE